MRKVTGGLRALSSWVDARPRNSDFLLADKLTYADIAVCSVLGFMEVRWAEHGWKEEYPAMERYFKKLDERESFVSTRPKAQVFSDPVV
jgi:glutathione S-transferase